jgi:signal transduction histidine kinase
MTRRHTLLVVDDETNVIQSLQDLLRRDYQVFGATSARDGLGLLRQHEMHIVLSDQRMPQTNGIEFLRQVRADHPEAIRLLCTGYADIKAVIDAINEGHVFRYITKPWDPDELLTVLHQAGEMHDLLKERQRLLQDLQTKNRELQRANALQEAFIRVASHELRTPLTILLGLPELALRMEKPNTAVADWFRRIHKAGLRLHHLVEQLLQMLQAGRFERPLDRRPTDLGLLIGEAVEDVRPFVQQRRQHLSLNLPADLGLVNVEAGKIRICLDHLLVNAIKFTPDGGAIEVRAERTANAVRLQVRDSGLGIPVDNLPHIFQPFFTELDVSRHSSGQFEFGRRGLGLGLSLVRAFVAMHGGTVEVASVPGQGSTFTLTLPGGATAEGQTANERAEEEGTEISNKEQGMSNFEGQTA